MSFLRNDDYRRCKTRRQGRRSKGKRYCGIGRRQHLTTDSILEFLKLKKPQAIAAFLFFDRHLDSPPKKNRTDLLRLKSPKNFRKFINQKQIVIGIIRKNEVDW
ncbi:hypothetical protein LBBP_00678 [Leptospira borgpetersenii serovar Ballum]|uniref:Uncharacterized protein n=1 Tax=Leptospira borgpetersenii serovar Ballum TaxID=280505 RepID=A0A0S2IN02_LEPBO|nr:hypothetical protein LBBP_00678 [Leptospira borgpetersenii serovar Ballum]